MEHVMTPAIGQLEKVWLPGETPWVECLAVHHDGSWSGRIDNHLVATTRHGIGFDDVVRFVPYPDAPRCPWRAAHLTTP